MGTTPSRPEVRRVGYGDLQYVRRRHRSPSPYEDESPYYRRLPRGPDRPYDVEEGIPRGPRASGHHYDTTPSPFENAGYYYRPPDEHAIPASRRHYDVEERRPEGSRRATVESDHGENEEDTPDEEVQFRVPPQPRSNQGDYPEPEAGSEPGDHSARGDGSRDGDRAPPIPGQRLGHQPHPPGCRCAEQSRQLQQSRRPFLIRQDHRGGPWVVEGQGIQLVQADDRGEVLVDPYTGMPWFMPGEYERRSARRRGRRGLVINGPYR